LSPQICTVGWRTSSTVSSTANNINDAYRQLSAQDHGMKIVASTMTPFESAQYYSRRGERMREPVNLWIRRSGAFDPVVDFNAALRGAQNPHRLISPLQPGNRLHPNDAEAIRSRCELSAYDSSVVSLFRHSVESRGAVERPHVLGRVDLDRRIPGTLKHQPAAGCDSAVSSRLHDRLQQLLGHDVEHDVAYGPPHRMIGHGCFALASPNVVM
jgi:hypothetical protein